MNRFDFLIYSLRENCPYLELFWSAFSRIRTEYGKIRSISPYSVRVRENAELNNPEYGHFLRSDFLTDKYPSKEENKATILEFLDCTIGSAVLKIA